MPRRSTSAPSDRGEDTRRRLLDAALEAFGRRGYEAVTTRALAEAAGVNLAAIPYHFGGKEGVYLAVVRDIVETVGSEVREAAERVRAEIADEPPSPEQLQAMLRTLVRALAERILGSPRAHLWAGVLIREQMQPTAAFDIAYDGYLRIVHETLTLLVARLLGASPDDPDVVIRTHALIGQVLVFRLAPEVLLRRLGWDRYTPRRIEQIIGVLIEQVTESLATPQGRR